jgi:hypothetical protein
LDNFSCVKKCQVADCQLYEKSFWKTLIFLGFPKRLTYSFSICWEVVPAWDFGIVLLCAIFLFQDGLAIADA